MSSYLSALSDISSSGTQLCTRWPVFGHVNRNVATVQRAALTAGASQYIKPVSTLKVSARASSLRPLGLPFAATVAENHRLSERAWRPKV
jgi:hypothetical protein